MSLKLLWRTPAPRMPLYAAEWAGYERVDRAQVTALLVEAIAAAPASFYARNMSGLDLSDVDFKGASLASLVLNRSKLQRANLARCNLTVSFREGVG